MSTVEIRTETADAAAKREGTLVRPVGALERLFFRYSERNPTHFLMVAEFDITLTLDQLRSALDAIQRRHPLLTVYVDDSAGDRLALYRGEHVAPIAVQVRSGAEWQAVAAEELSRPFDRTTTPMMRATLLTASAQSVVLLTFDHTIADGISSVRVLDDLVAALNGNTLEPLPVPETVETILARTFSTVPHASGGEPAELDPRMRTPSAIRTFDGTPPEIRSAALSEVDTRRLLDRCRHERTTVHAAVLTAASRVRSQQVGESFVRTLSPINVRPLLGIGGDCVDYFVCAVTGLAPFDGASFWDQARAVASELAVARSAAGVVAVSGFISDAMGVDADTTSAEEVFTRAVPFELMVTNLGVQDLETTGPIRPTALWAPIVETQVAGGIVIGLTTYRGVLRLVTSGYAAPGGYLAAVSATLGSASGDPGEFPSAG